MADKKQLYELAIEIGGKLNGTFSPAFNKAIGNIKKLEAVAQKAGQGMLVAGTAMAAGMGAGLKVAGDFEQKMADVKAVTQATATQSEQFKKLAMSMDKIGYNGTDAAAGIENMFRASLDMQTVLNGGLLSTLQLATAANIGTGEAAEIAAAQLNTFSREHLSVAKAADILAGADAAGATSISSLSMGLAQVGSIATNSGLSFMDTAAALAMFEKNGVRGSDAGTSFKTMLQNLQPRTDDQIEAFVRLGFAQGKLLKVTKDGKEKYQLLSNAFYDSRGKMKSLAEIAELLQSKLGKLTDKQKQYDLETMFGTDAIRAGNIFSKEGGSGFQKVLSDMGETNVSQMAITKLDTFNGSMKILGALVYNLGVKIGDSLLPYIKPMLSGLSKGVEWFSKLPKEVVATTAAIAGIGTILLIAGGIIGAVVIPAITSLFIAFSSISVWIASISAFIGSTAFLTSSLYPLISALEMVGMVIVSAIEAIAFITGLSVAATGVIAGVVIAFFGILIYKYWPAISGFFEGVALGFSEAVKPVAPVLSQIAAFLGALMQTIGNAIGQIFGLTAQTNDGRASMISFGKAVGEVIGKVVTLIAKIIELGAQLLNMKEWTAFLQANNIKSELDAETKRKREWLAAHPPKKGSGTSGGGGGGGGGGAGVKNTIHYQPTINIKGNGDKSVVKQAVDESLKHFEKQFRQLMAKNNRLGYAP